VNSEATRENEFIDQDTGRWLSVTDARTTDSASNRAIAPKRILFVDDEPAFSSS
jgi:hypothetical protein